MNYPPPSLLFPASIGTLCVLAANTPEGDFVEVGVYRGGTAWYLQAIAAYQRRRLHLFDTFTGIPDKSVIDEQHNVGDFGDTSLELVMRSLSVGAASFTDFYAGRFPDTMPTAFPSVAFVHVDCDQYQAVLDCIKVFWPLLVEGGVMLFDDWNCTTGCQQAVHEGCAGLEVYTTQEGKLFARKPTAAQIAAREAAQQHAPDFSVPVNA